MEQNSESYTYKVIWFLTKQYWTGERKSLSTNGAGITGYQYRENKPQPQPYTIHKKLTECQLYLNKAEVFRKLIEDGSWN